MHLLGEMYSDHSIGLSTNIIMSFIPKVIKGAALSYSCGLVASGKAVVFNRDGPRMFQTIELNTTISR